MITPLNAVLRVAERDGLISHGLHQWLQILARAVSTTYAGDQAPGHHLAIPNGQFAIHGKRLTLKGSERLTLIGDSRLVICG